MIALSVRRALGAALAIAGAGALATLSGARYDALGKDEAMIRLAWRARGERVHACRRLTPTELERLPVHMRREEVCEDRSLPYRLFVRVDGRAVVDDTVRPGGARQDRPLYVLRDLPLAPGAHEVDVVFEREDGEAAGGEERETVREHREETPPRLILTQGVTLAARQIVLVTYDDESKTLHLLAAPPGRP